MSDCELADCELKHQLHRVKANKLCITRNILSAMRAPVTMIITSISILKAFDGQPDFDLYRVHSEKV